MKKNDACKNCKYDYSAHCKNYDCDCDECEMFNDGDCKCLAIKPDEECPYFEEKEYDRTTD